MFQRKKTDAGGEPRRTRRARLAVVLGPAEITVLELRPSLRGRRPHRLVTRPLARREGECWPDLEAALLEIRDELGVGAVRLDVAVLPPLAQAKVLPLPPVRQRELHPLVVRNARRYFLLPDSGPVVVEAIRLRQPRRGQPAPTLVGCCSEGLVSCVSAAVAGAGFRLGTIAAAPLAQLCAATSRVPLLSRGRVVLVIASGARSEALFLERGRPRLIEPLPPFAASRASEFTRRVSEGVRRAAEAGVGADRVVVCAGEDTQRVLDALGAGSEGLPEVAPAPGLAGLSAELLAALGAGLVGSGVPLLRSGSQREAVRRREVVRAAALAGLSALMLAGAAGVHLWGLRQELQALQAQRRELSPVVTEVRAARQKIMAIRDLLGAVEQMEKVSPRWTMEIRALAEALPASSYLSTVRVDGTQLHLTGFGSSASAVVPALEASPRFTGATLSAPVRREQTLGRETFDLVLTLDSVPEPPRSTPQKKISR